MASLRSIGRIAGAFGGLWLCMGIVGPRRWLALALRILWTLLFLLHATALLVGTAVDASRVTPEYWYNIVLAATMALLGACMLVFNGPAVAAVVDSVADGLARRRADDRVLAKTRLVGHVVGSASMLLSIPMCILFAYRDANETRAVDKTLPFEHVPFAAVVTFVGYMSGFVQAGTVVIMGPLLRMELVRHPSDELLSHARRIVRVLALQLAVVPVLGAAGLALFLFTETATDRPDVLVNAFVVTTICMVIAVDSFATLRVFSRVRTGVPKRAIDARRSSAESPEEQTDDGERLSDGDAADEAPPSFAWTVGQPMKLAALSGGMIALWLVPWLIVAGPPSALEGDEQTSFWMNHADMVQGAPAVIFACLVFAPLYGFTPPILLAAIFHRRDWPKHLFSLAPPATVIIMALQFNLARSEFFLVMANAGTTLVIVTQMILLYLYLRKVRPQWNFVLPLLAVVLLAVALTLLVVSVAVPTFLSRSSTDADKIVVRLAAELVWSSLSLSQIPFAERMWKDPVVSHHYVPYLMTAPLAFIGRLMVGSVDALVSQFIAVTILAVFEVGIVAFGPLLTTLAVAVWRRDGDLRGAVDTAVEYTSDPVMASRTVVHGATEYIGIVLSTLALVVHALAWYDDIDTTAILLRFFLSMLMQLAVEFVADAAIAHIHLHWHGMQFRLALARARRVWMAAILAFSFSAILGIASGVVPMLCHRIVKAFHAQ